MCTFRVLIFVGPSLVGCRHVSQIRCLSKDSRSTNVTHLNYFIDNLCADSVSNTTIRSLQPSSTAVSCDKFHLTRKSLTRVCLTLVCPAVAVAARGEGKESNHETAYNNILLSREQQRRAVSWRERPATKHQLLPSSTFHPSLCLLWTSTSHAGTRNRAYSQMWNEKSWMSL